VDKDEFVFYEREVLEPIYKDPALFRKGNASQPDEAVVEQDLFFILVVFYGV